MNITADEVTAARAYLEQLGAIEVEVTTHE